MWHTNEDARRLAHWDGVHGEGLRNIANDPEYIEKQRNELYMACIEMKENRRNQAIYAIKKQPFYA